MINNKIHSVTKVSLFMANYGRKLRMGANIGKKRKVEKAMKFAKRIKKMQEKVGAALRKSQEEIKRQADRRRKEVEEWRKGDIKYKRLSVQKKTSKKASRLICWSIHH